MSASAAQIADLRALREAATQGPLRKRCLGPGSCHFAILRGDGEEIATWLTEADADFFIAAHAAMGDLLASPSLPRREWDGDDNFR